MRIACFIVQPFYKRSAQKGQSKQHCMCTKEKQNISSQSFICNTTTLKLPLARVCSTRLLGEVKQDYKENITSISYSESTYYILFEVAEALL